MEPSSPNRNQLPNPSLRWIEKPSRFSHQGIKSERRNQMIHEMGKFEKLFDGHVDGQSRVEDRESCVLRLSFKKKADNDIYNV